MTITTSNSQHRHLTSRDRGTEVRRVALSALIAFSVFYLLTNPDGATAGFGSRAFDALRSAASSLSPFLSNL